MRSRILVAILALAVTAMVTGCPGKDKTKGELGNTRPGGAAGGEQGNATGDNAGRGDVKTTDLNKGLKTIYFDFDKYNLRDDARATLDANAKILRDDPDMRIVIQGHCDERGTDEYNLALGERRAKSARDYLVKLGIDASKIDLISYGEERPVAPGHDESAWTLNRRGEFVPK
jgi:peptidoglycan-associated lipoprotein